MTKMNMKAEMMEQVKAAAKSYNEEKGYYTMTAEAFAKVEAELNEKFVIKAKDDKRAIAYKSKKSENLVLVKIVAEKKADKKAADKKQSKKQQKAEKQSNGSAAFKFSYKMQKDTGMAIHFCEFEMQNATEEQFEEFIEKVNKNFEEIFGTASNIEYDMVDEVDGGYEGRIIFAKIKGHSKDGYAAYKQAMTAAKKEMK